MDYSRLRPNASTTGRESVDHQEAYLYFLEQLKRSIPEPFSLPIQLIIASI